MGLFYRGPSLAELHSNYAKQHRIDPTAQLVSTSTIDISAPGDEVWSALVDVAGWPRWAPHVEVLRVDEVRPDAKFRWRLKGVTIEARFAVVDPSRELSWTGTFFGYRAIDRNLLETLDASHTRVTFEESLAGLLLPLLYRPSQLRANHLRWLSALKAFAERRAQASRPPS